MKKIFFSIMAITMLSTAGFATKHTSARKKQAAKCECPAGCPKKPDCHKPCSK